jgi:hypothetical protein
MKMEGLLMGEEVERTCSGCGEPTRNYDPVPDRCPKCGGGLTAKGREEADRSKPVYGFVVCLGQDTKFYVRPLNHEDKVEALRAPTATEADALAEAFKSRTDEMRLEKVVQRTLIRVMAQMKESSQHERLAKQIMHGRRGDN